MLTVGHMGTTDSSPAGVTRSCHRCQQPIAYALTYLGTKLAFDPHPVPRKWDYDGTGWITGYFPIAGRPRIVLAPLPEHTADKRRRAAHVLHLHTCPTASAA